MPVNGHETGQATAPLAPDAARDGRRRGEGVAMAGATFRDPPDLEAQAAALRREIAAVLVRAPALPVPLPAFGLTLLSVAAERRGIALVVGKEQPISQLRIEPADRAGAGGVSGPAVRVSVIELHADTGRFARELGAMARRLAKAITVEQWQRALGVARRLRELPVDVPLAFFRQLVPGVGGQGLVRTGFTCNQNCGICWQDRDWGRFDSEQVLTWIEDLRAAGANGLIISGGEPTLDASLERYIARARELGFRDITLETNAIQFAKPGLAERLRDAGLSTCFVSLHSGDAATSDAITRAPGTFQRTVAGIRALLAARVPVRLNCVMTREGIDHLAGVPAFIHETFGADACLQGLMLSQPTDPYDRALVPAIVPEPERLRAALRLTLDSAFALGIAVSGLDGPCGPPLCAFDADRRVTRLEPIPERLDGRTYLPACATCAVRAACFGVRVADVALYGDACAHPLAAEPAA